MTIELKPGVCPTGVRPELVLAAMVAWGVCAEEGVGLTITSLNDGKHSETSLHYAGAGLDLRTRTLPKARWKPVRDTLARRLGRHYDVVLERDHIHVEWQPRRAVA